MGYLELAKKSMEDPPPLTGMYTAIGEAIQEYAEVESTLASTIEHILKIDFQRAHAILFAVQNIRSRHELIETLLYLEFGSKLEKYWASCSRFLGTLAQFRNAIAHWHPSTNLYLIAEPDHGRAVNALSHPVLSKNYKGIEEVDFPPFLKDCRYIREELSSLNAMLKARPSALPEKFQQPISGRNQATLQPRRKPKAQQYPPRSSPGKVRKPKLSSAQRRKRALAATQRRKR